MLRLFHINTPASPNLQYFRLNPATTKGKAVFYPAMLFERIITYFLPRELQQDKTHPKYNELRNVLSTTLIGLSLMLFFPPIVYFIHKPITGFLVNNLLIASIILSIKYFGHYRIPMSLTAIVTYYIIYDWIRDTGLIYSSNVSILHMYLLAAIWADKKYGWLAIFTNLALFAFIYYQTLQAYLPTGIDERLGGPLYALTMNCLITIFFGGFLAYLQLDQERDRAKIRSLQDQKISVLDETVKNRTEQLNNMRETIATDFHDETGNMLSAITRQASLLKLKSGMNPETQPLIDSIIKNSNDLYASSKDFLWHLNHNSDDPTALFNYLTGYGQVYYNQFDIAFSSSAEPCQPSAYIPSGALDVIYILKEAMTNVAKHANASEIMLRMTCRHHQLQLVLSDNGTWKETDSSTPHYGLNNMQRRCNRNGFTLRILKYPSGTQLVLEIPVKHKEAFI
ncbi:histidine kinase [Chitinophaga sedimenti]|uniref:sensor histidine kinase n=1 Tax=Chitinophaga sedimenti TaxID=2033606 RepID=UPI0020058BAD|nr:histidine kinase [Chitinophaga sedimenti]MCK7558063.1 histidine kinase [Chitinophaga sedimenti]